MNFNYSTLKVELLPKTKSISIFLNRTSEENRINIEMLFELESLFAWCSTHLEIKSILLSSANEIFSKGLDKSELKIMSEEKLKKYLAKYQKLIFSMLHLPQTIICDLKSFTSDIGIELALAADIRIAKDNCIVDFNGLNTGWIPCAGGVSLLSNLVGHSRARQWALSSVKLTASLMIDSGLIIDSYKNNNNSLINTLLEKINIQSSVARIQLKRSLLEQILPEIERGLQYEAAFALANISTNDWKQDNYHNFVNPKEVSSNLKNH